jgi:ABC-type spermidine/putrescine transport system permease subunit II
MLALLTHLQVDTLSILTSIARRRERLRSDAGQTTAEYALVLLGAVAIAALLITWASKSGAIGKLFDAVMSHVIGSVT